MSRVPVPCLALLFACSDYGFNPSDEVEDPWDPKPADTARPEGDTDTDADTDTDTDTVIEDDCYDPDSTYDMHPAAGLMVVGEQEIVVRYAGSEAGYTSELWLETPERVHLGTGHVTAEGSATSLGTYPPGTELVFAIRVTDTGHVFYSGPASRNADGFDHAAITYAGDCRWLVGFEDEFGGGDQDFNDISLTISGQLEMQLVQ